jgi:hypothetical protein
VVWRSVQRHGQFGRVRTGIGPQAPVGQHVDAPAVDEELPTFNPLLDEAGSASDSAGRAGLCRLETLERTLKLSAEWLREAARQNAVVA